jgi:hypothetical protein
MTGITETGSLRTLLDVVGWSIPVVGEMIKFLHVNPFALKTIPDRRNEPQCRDQFFIPGIESEHETGFCGRVSAMTCVAVTVFRRGMATVTAYLILMLEMGNACRQPYLISQLMTIQTGGPVLHFLLRFVHLSISMDLSLFVTIHAHQSFFIMDIGTAAILAGKFRVYSPAMAECARLSFVFFHETVPLDETDINPADLRGLYMAITAGSVTGPAGLFKNLSVKSYRFGLGKSLRNAISLAYGRIVERLFIR